MRTMKRAAAIAGLALMTGGFLSVTATAASAAPTQESTAVQSTEHDRRGGDWDDRGRDWGRRDRTYTAGWFDSRQECRFKGWVGEQRGRWENPRCYRVNRHTWILRVEPNHRRWH
jgi:hypothetical protein